MAKKTDEITSMDVEILDEQFDLYPQKAIFWRTQHTLLLSDLHLGKINHFRKAGIPVPAKANDHNLEVLIDLIRLCKPKRIICLGDLFHSHYNAEWEVFGEVVKHFSDITFDLVIGNHDIMGQYQYRRKGIALHDTLQIGKFLLTHHPMEEVPAGVYNTAEGLVWSEPSPCLIVLTYRIQVLSDLRPKKMQITL